MTIKHLVIPGGGPTGIRALGTLQQLEKRGFWHIDNIETIYATSAGALIALLIALKFDWVSINDYIVLRNWHETYKVTASHIFSAYTKKGLFDKSMFDIFYKPFFDSKDLPMTMTMKEFYEYSKIELHFFALEMNTFEVIDISYKTFPDIPVIQSVHMSCAIPLLICPVCVDKHFYIDGGVVTNYPVKHCLDRQPAPNVDEIFGIKNVYENIDTDVLNNDSTMLDYAMTFISKLIRTVDTSNRHTGLIPNELPCKTIELNFTYMKDTLFSGEKRQSLLDAGFADADLFLDCLSEAQITS